VEKNDERTDARGKKSRSKRARGGLVLATTPPTDVYLGRRHLGRTPIEVADLPAGKLTVRLKNEKPKIGTTAELRIAAGKTTRKHIQLDQGTLMVHVTPWAEVWVDGKKVGTTPIQPVRLYEGRHEVLLTNPKTGRSQRRTVVISAGKTARLSEELQ
jgi:serine/threonine-protein kinase